MMKKLAMIVSTLLKIEWYRRGNIQGNLNSILKIFKEFEKLWPCIEEFKILKAEALNTFPCS